jgi:hypothetical protein
MLKNPAALATSAFVEFAVKKAKKKKGQKKIESSEIWGEMTVHSADALKFIYTVKGKLTDQEGLYAQVSLFATMF